MKTSGCMHINDLKSQSQQGATADPCPQDAGIHVIFHEDALAAAAHPNVVQLSPSLIPELLDYANNDLQTAVAAFHFILAHEMAHLYLRHTVRPAGMTTYSRRRLSCHALLPVVHPSPWLPP